MTATSTAAEAIVTTLTAEVRTLVVGSRQVTLSVAKQLDTAPLEDLAVMGRVRVSNDFTHVIGTAKDGSLALARYRPHLKLDRDIDLMLRLETDHLPEKVTVCRYTPRVDRAGNSAETYGSHYYRFTSGTRQGRPFLLSTKATVRCTADHDRSRQDCGGGITWSELGKLCGEELMRQHVEQCLIEQRHRAAAEAPLIVLAGLK